MIFKFIILIGVEALLEKFANFLFRKGLRLTEQRQLIARAFFNRAGHISAEELYDEIKQETPSIGFATVYRTLKLLVEAGQAALSNFGDGYTRFETTADKKHHDHLICQECGKIVEFANDHIETLQEKVATEHGFLVRDHTLDIYGICRTCQGQST